MPLSGSRWIFDSNRAVIRVGPAGWSYADWEGPIHPRPKPAEHHPLDDLSKVFDVVELNVSFYRLPNPEQVAQWLERVEERTHFRFAVKLLGDFTHQRRFETPRDLERGLDRFFDCLGPLAGSPRLATVLAQFPLSFQANPRSGRYLGILARALGERLGGRPPVLELRHRSWFTGPAAELLHQSGASIARIDLPASSDHPPVELPFESPLGYMRMHGRNAQAWFDPQAGRDDQYSYDYSSNELASLAAHIKTLATRSGETYVITNNHFAGQAIANGVELIDLLLEHRPQIPARWIDAYPRLGAIADPVGQTGLFG